MIKKILITGGAGFIGFHLARRLLNEGHYVSILDNFSRGVEDQELKKIVACDNASLVNLNLLDKQDLLELDKDFDIIFHLAAIIGVKHVLANPYNVLYDNIQVLANMIEFACNQKKLSRFFFASTSEVYAGTLKNFQLPVPTPETIPLATTDLSEPRTSYMLSKIYGEALCHHAGIPYTIFRPHNIYGPRMGMAHVIPEQLNKAHTADDGDQVDVFSVDHMRSFCFVDDAVEFLVRMSFRDECAGKTLNLGSQTPEISMKELVEICHKIVGKNLKISAKPASPGSPPRRAPDMTQTTQLTEYQPQVGLEEGIKRTYEWYRSYVFNSNDKSAV